MSDKRIDTRRRALLNTALGLGALGAALPGSWTKPIVNAVVLPAHGMTSAMFTVEKVQSGGPSPAMVVGDVIEYEIVVTNTGAIDLTNVVATDTMPDGTVVVLSGEVESLTTDGVLNVGETWTYTTSYEVTAADIMAGADLRNSVSVVTDEVPTPEVDDVDTPVEAVVCPEIVIDDVIVSDVGSGTVICSMSFDVFSADATPLTITSITNTTLSTDAAVTYPAFPAIVTDVTGARVSWSGGFSTPECQIPLFSLSDVVFSVTATCEGALDPITMDFNLIDIAALG